MRAAPLLLQAAERGPSEPRPQKQRGNSSLEEMRPEFTVPEPTPYVCHQEPGAQLSEPQLLHPCNGGNPSTTSVVELKNSAQKI